MCINQKYLIHQGKNPFHHLFRHLKSTNLTKRKKTRGNAFMVARSYKYSGYDDCTNSSHWWPKDKSLNHQPPKDSNPNDLEVFASCVIYLL